MLAQGWQEAGEQDCVTKPLFGQNNHRFACQIAAIPLRQIKLARCHFFGLPAHTVGAKGRAVAPLAQLGKGALKLDFAIVGMVGFGSFQIVNCVTISAQTTQTAPDHRAL